MKIRYALSAFFALLFCAFSPVAFSQAAASLDGAVHESWLGQYTNSGCSSTLTWCFVPYSATNPLPVATTSYPTGATPITASATGTTAATTATLAGASGHTTYLCGFSIRANATAAATGNATVTGTITGALNFTQWTAPLATGIGVTEPPIGELCIAASAANTGIAVTSAAPGTGGTVSVTAWGYQL